MRPLFENYRATLSPDHEALFDHDNVVDVAYKVVGVGSVGTRCFSASFAASRPTTAPTLTGVRASQPGGVLPPVRAGDGPGPRQVGGTPRRSRFLGGNV
jgi:hypothetical protein